THELGIYVGAAPLLLAMVGLPESRRWRAWRWLGGVGAALAGAALLWSFGQYGPLGPVQQWMPVVNSFRFACRAIVAFQLGIAMLAACGIAAVAGRIDGGQTENQTLPAIVWWLAMASGTAALTAPLFWPDYVAPWPLIAAGPL